MQKREHLGILKNYKDFLIINEIRYLEDLREIEELKTPEANVSKKEVDMALKLINQLTSHFEPKKYKDTYHERLLQVIEDKKKGRKTKVKKEEYVEEPKVVDLMEMLKKSLEKKKKSA